MEIDQGSKTFIFNQSNINTKTNLTQVSVWRKSVGDLLSGVSFPLSYEYILQLHDGKSLQSCVKANG